MNFDVFFCGLKIIFPHCCFLFRSNCTSIFHFYFLGSFQLLYKIQIIFSIFDLNILFEKHMFQYARFEVLIRIVEESHYRPLRSNCDIFGFPPDMKQPHVSHYVLVALCGGIFLIPRCLPSSEFPLEGQTVSTRVKAGFMLCPPSIKSQCVDFP